MNPFAKAWEESQQHSRQLAVVSPGHANSSHAAKKGLITLEILVGFFIVLMMYLFAFAPQVNLAVDNYTTSGNASTLSVQIVGLIAPFIFIMLLAGLYVYAKGGTPSWDK